MFERFTGKTAVAVNAVVEIIEQGRGRVLKSRNDRHFHHRDPEVLGSYSSEFHVLLTVKTFYISDRVMAYIILPQNQKKKVNTSIIYTQTM